MIQIYVEWEDCVCNGLTTRSHPLSVSFSHSFRVCKFHFEIINLVMLLCVDGLPFEFDKIKQIEAATTDEKCERKR